MPLEIWYALMTFAPWSANYMYALMTFRFGQPNKLGFSLNLKNTLGQPIKFMPLWLFALVSQLN